MGWRPGLRFLAPTNRGWASGCRRVTVTPSLPACLHRGVGEPDPCPPLSCEPRCFRGLLPSAANSRSEGGPWELVMT